MPTLWQRSASWVTTLWVFALVTLAAGAASAQNLRVIPVPWDALDTTVPHAAYNGHATTFKAIARGGNGTYQYEWDFEGDGVFDTSRSTNNRYNLSERFTYPNQAAMSTFRAVVRVTSNGETVSAVYPVRVVANVPANPVNATDRQLQLMRGIAVDDGLWYLHNRMTRSGFEEDPLTGAQVTGNIGENTTASAASFLWSLSLAGHYAAFPAAYIGPMPNPAENTARFAGDPYAEDAARLVNYLLTQATVVYVEARDEANLVGFYPEETKVPIDGTDDGVGLYIGSSPGDQTVYYMGHAVSALSVAHLGGYVAQAGDSNRILGRRMEFVLQQLVDGLVWAQNDAGSYPGSWYYSPNANSDDLSTTLWGMTGLWNADTFARDQGVIVPNLVKARLANYIMQNRTPCPGAGGGPGAIFGGTYTAGYRNVCDHTLTAGHILALGWVGANIFAANDAGLAFPSYNGLTRGQLRNAYDTALNFISGPQFVQSSSTSISWNTGSVLNGDFSRADGQGNHYDMLHWHDAALAVKPAIVTFGANNWARLYSRYFVNNQAAGGGWNWVGAYGANSDNSAGAGLRAGWAMLVLAPDAIPPIADAGVEVLAGDEGDTFRFSASASDPGTGNLTYHWDFGDGTTQNLADVTHTYPDNGVYPVTLTTTSRVGTSTDVVTVTVGNVAPSVSDGPNLTALEGSPVAFAATVDDPGVLDTFTYLWDFDGTGVNTSTAAAPTYTYADDGLYNVGVTVTDKDGASGSDTLTVTVNNVAPTVTSTPSLTAAEGDMYSYTLTFTDPGVNDTHTCVLDRGPAGMTPTGCTVDWTPNFVQALGPAAPVTFCAIDNHGDRGCQTWSIDVTYVDTDDDGLPDAWEIDAFGNIAAQDQFGDPDADGLRNLQELMGGTDPNRYDGPSEPVAVVPVCGSEVASPTPTLEVANATDPQGTSLTYEFELYADAALARPVAQVRGYPQGDGRTRWTVPAALVENETYFWRARAADGYISGGWTPVCSFMVNVANESPSAPRLNAPAVGSRVASSRPTLVVDDAVDPDHNVLTYAWEVYADPGLANLVTSVAGTADNAAATASWGVDAALTEDHAYWWRAKATDSHGAASPWSPVGDFFVNAVNTAPEAPTLALPQDATEVSEHTPTFLILNSVDPDRDALTYDFEVATDDTFATLVVSDRAVPEQGTDNTAWHPPVSLTEDAHYCWRARANDGVATSAWAVACFLVSATDNAPSTPAVVSPACGSEVPVQSPTLEFTNAVDPQGWSVTYEIELYLDAGLTRAIERVSGYPQGVGSTQWTPSAVLVENEYYFWRARAVNARVAGSWSPVCSFMVNIANESPSAPRLDAPDLGSRVASSTPSLVVDDAVDPEHDVLTYTWEVYADAGLTRLVNSAAGTADNAGGTASWAVDAALGEDHWYWWRAQATDVHGAASPWTAVGSFFVSTGNTGPEAPTLLLPRNGTVVSELAPTFVLLNADDQDLDLLTYDFELATDDTFVAPLASDEALPAQGANTTAWRPDVVLTEDSHYCWRARASDGLAAGDWAVACFAVSATNNAPSTPTLMNPSDQTVVPGQRPVFTWNAATDPEGDGVTYAVQLFDNGALADPPVALAPAVAATSTVLGIDLADGSTYSWRVRAVDAGGAAGAWSAANQFTVRLSSAPVDVTDTDGDGLPDVWEVGFFGSIDAADQFGDPDQDGMNNLQEFHHHTDPTVYDGPSGVQATAPDCGSTVSTLSPNLTVGNATNPRNQPLLYTFELYADAAQSQLVERVIGLAQGAGAETSWTPTVVLDEDHLYFWRARAADASVAGAWSDVCSVFVSASNAAPSIPEPQRPFDGSVVSLSTPSLGWFAAVDPEHQAVVYDVEVFQGSQTTGTPVFAANDVAATAIAVNVTLADGPAVWHVRAKDEQGATSDWSAGVRFDVATAEPAPTTPDASLADARTPDAHSPDADTVDGGAVAAHGAASGGCGCKAAGNAPSGSWLFVIGLGMLGRARTRRSRRG